MAFITSLTLSSGIVLSEAYIRASITSNKSRCVVTCEVYASQAARMEGRPPIASDNFQRIFELVSVESVNPVDYAYKLLEQSNEFPGAIWNQ